MSPIENAGNTLINIIWIQGIIVDLIIFKKHPRVLEFFIKNNRSPSLGAYRKELWRKYFYEIIPEFKNCYPNPHQSWFDKIEYFNNIRNAISHGRIWLNRDFILYEPSNPSKVAEFERIVGRKKPKTKTIEIKFDDNNFKKILTDFNDFDKKFFPALCKELGLDYNRIR